MATLHVDAERPSSGRRKRKRVVPREGEEDKDEVVAKEFPDQAELAPKKVAVLNSLQVGGIWNYPLSASSPPMPGEEMEEQAASSGVLCSRNHLQVSSNVPLSRRTCTRVRCHD